MHVEKIYCDICGNKIANDEQNFSVEIKPNIDMYKYSASKIHNGCKLSNVCTSCSKKYFEPFIHEHLVMVKTKMGNILYSEGCLLGINREIVK